VNWTAASIGLLVVALLLRLIRLIHGRRSD
jgi:hypothetical protein